MRTTYEVAFPTWRDLAHLRVVVSRNDILLERLSDPFEVARMLCPLIERDTGFSGQMQLASTEFRRLYEAKATLLRLHRFWGAIHHVLSEFNERKTISLQVDPVLILELGSGIDEAEATIFLAKSGQTLDDSDDNSSWNGPAHAIVDGAKDWLRARMISLMNSFLVTAINDGVILLREMSFARWQTANSIEELFGRCIFLRKNGTRKDLNDLGRHLGKLSSNWEVRGPFEGMAKANLFSKLGINQKNKSNQAEGFRLFEGIKVGAAYLGRKPFLPKFFALGDGRVRISDIENLDLHVELIERKPREFALASESAVTGFVSLQLEETPVNGIDSLIFEKRIQFVSEADEHADLRVVDNSRWSVIDELSVVSTPEVQSSCTEPGTFSNVLSCTKMEDLAEALYARGANGWSESDIVSLIYRVRGEDGPSVWDVLRGLQEAGWLEVTQLTTWRTRRWWLRYPELSCVASDSGELIVLGGSCPDTIRRRFRSTVEYCGGRVFKLAPPGEFCSVRLGAIGVNIETLLTELQWNRANPPGSTNYPAPACWPVVMEDVTRHEPVAVWDMVAGHSRPVQEFALHQVELVRHRRETGDRADLFTVRGGRQDEPSWTGLSRTAAILEAYRRVQCPMFEVRGKWLVRLTNDGYLPLPVAKIASLRTLLASGPYLDGERWTYAYPLDAYLLTEIIRLFGKSIISGLGEDCFISESNRLAAGIMGRERARYGQRNPARGRFTPF